MHSQNSIDFASNPKEVLLSILMYVPLKNSFLQSVIKLWSVKYAIEAHM